MICPECEKESKISKVYPGSSLMTLMYAAPFYDERGEYHHHDPNVITTTYKCTNGHAWTEIRKLGSCWCGWGDKVGET